MLAVSLNAGQSIRPGGDFLGRLDEALPILSSPYGAPRVLIPLSNLGGLASCTGGVILPRGKVLDP